MFLKKGIWFSALLILLLAFLLMVTGCQSNTPEPDEPSVNSKEPAESAIPAVDPVPSQGSQIDDSTFKEYTEPGTYSIKYPEGWILQGGGQKLGFEILSLYKVDPEAANKGPHGGQDPNSAKIAVSIDLKAGRSFEQAVQDYYNNNELDNRDDKSQEELVVDGKQAVRFYYTFDNPIISLLVDIDQERYAIITGYHGGGSEKDKLIEEIKLTQESFRVLASSESPAS